MRLLLLAATLFMGTPTWARPDGPELIAFSEYQAMSPANQEAYLKIVAEGLAQFEAASNEVFAEEKFAAYPYFKEIFADVIRAALPEAAAVPAGSDTPVDCLNVEFTTTKNSAAGTFCLSSPTDHLCTNPTGWKTQKRSSLIPTD